MKNNDSVKLLLTNLLEKDYYFDELLELLHVDKESLILMINNINYSYSLPLININQEIVTLDFDILEKGNLALRYLTELEHYNYGKRIRKKLYLILLLLKQQYLPIEALIEVVQVSKNTVVSDIRELRNDLKTISIGITYNRQGGYSINGNELELRRILISTIEDILELREGILILARTGHFNFTEVNHLRSKIEIFEKKFQMTFTDDKIHILPYQLYSVIERVKKSGINLSKFYNLKGTEEFSTVKKIFWDFEFLNDLDLLYLTFLVMSANVIKDGEFNLVNNSILEDSVETFIHNIEQDIAVQFEDRKKLKDDLISHLRPAIYRTKLNLHVINGVTDSFIEKYGFFYELVQAHISALSSVLNVKKFSKDETVLVAMIVFGNISRSKKQLTPFTGVVVCKNGKAISHLILNILSELLPNIKIIRVMSKRQFEKEKLETDFVFTTVPIKTEIPTFTVSSILTSYEQTVLKNKVTQKIHEDPKLKAREVIYSITSLIPEETKKDVLDALSIFFAKENEETLPFRSFLNSIEQITILKDKILWKNLVDIAFQKILDRGNITSEYIEDCKKQFYNSYETQIISSEVLLPHSEPEKGVIHPDVQVVLLDNPLETSDGKCYQMIIALAPGFENEHVQWLVEVNKKLRDKESRNYIFNSRSEKELFEKLL